MSIAALLRRRAALYTLWFRRLEDCPEHADAVYPAIDRATRAIDRALCAEQGPQ